MMPHLHCIFRSYASPAIVTPLATLRARSETEDEIESSERITTDVDSTTISKSTAITSSTTKKKGPSNFELDNSHYMGIDAVKKLRMHYNVNKVCTACDGRNLALCV